MSAKEMVTEYVKDVRLEMAKISWPTRDELVDSTRLVLVTIILISAFVGVVDLVLGFSVGLLYH